MTDILRYATSVLCLIIVFGFIAPSECAGARAGTPPEIVVGGEDDGSDEERWDPDGYFTVGSDDETVRKVQGEPDEKFFDGHQEEWYYGPDTVYYNAYWEVEGVDNKDGKLKIR